MRQLSIHLVLIALFPVIARCEPARAFRLSLKPAADEERTVYVHAPELGSAWRLRLPERVLADPKTILIDHRGAPCRWESAGTRVTAVYPADHASSSAAQIAFRVSVNSVDDGLALSFTIENRSGRTLPNVVAHVCLSHDYGNDPAGERFAEHPGYRRTFLVTERGLTSLAGIDRQGAGGGIRSHYRVAGAAPIGFFHPPGGWGRHSATIAAEPWIAATSVSGNWTVAMWWEQASELFQNSDVRNRCIHSDPAFGDLPPGHSVSRYGRLDLVPGGPAAALARYRRRNPDR